LKVFYTCSLILIFLFFLPYQLLAVPTVSYSLNKTPILVDSLFSFELTISWEGDPDQYLIAPPQITLPEGIEEKGSSFSTISKGKYYILKYKYNLYAKKTGEYELKPIEISYWEKGNNREEKLRTKSLPFQVTSFSITQLMRYRSLGVLLVILLGLSISLIVLYKKKKRATENQKSDITITSEEILGELEQCNAYKIKGDWGNYLKKAVSIQNKLCAQGERGKIIEELDTLAERLTYGGLCPTAEEINLIHRQLERAIKNAFPNDKDKDLDGIKFR